MLKLSFLFRDKILTLRLKNELPSNYNAVKVIIRLKVPTCVNRYVVYLMVFVFYTHMTDFFL